MRACHHRPQTTNLTRKSAFSLHKLAIGLAVIALGGIVAGCQAGRRIGGLVQVQSQPSDDIPDIEPPAQRLAGGTSKLTRRNATDDRSVVQRSSRPENRRPSDSVIGMADTGPRPRDAQGVSARISSQDPGKTSVKPASASEPTVETSIVRKDSATEAAKASYKMSDRPEIVSRTEARVASDTTNRSVSSETISDQDDSKDKVVAKQRSRNRSTRDTERLLQREPESKQSRTAASTKPEKKEIPSKQSIVSDQDADRVLDAFSSSSPEVQQQALRQLLTLAASSAQRSAQPSSIDTLLQQAMASPVDLPEPRRTPSLMQTTRLGNVPEQVDASEDKIADARGSDDGDELQEAAPEVVAVSAASTRGDRSKIARAIESSDSTDEETAVQNAVAKVSNALLSDEALFDMLIRRLQRPSKDEGDAQRHRRQIMIRHLMVMSGRPDAAVEEMEGLTTGEQEFLRHQLMGLWTILDPDGHPVQSRRFSSALPEIRAATKHLAASTDSLEVKSLAFCTQIEAYGQIKEFAAKKFAPGQQVLLYCEVDNFAAKTLDQGGYETHLQGSYTVYDKDNKKVSRQVLPADQQVSRNYLRDYYIAYQMPIPSELAPGQYRLELTMEDLHGKKYGQSSIEFSVKP